MNSENAASELTPFEGLGGEAPVRALVDRFYDLMDLEPGYAELRATHGSTLGDARDKLFWFLCGQRLRESFFKTADWMRNKGL